MSATGAGGRALLAFATVAVAFAATDTYVVVMALPEMMGAVGASIDQLQRAAPIISGFLLGYVAMLPLIGRVADLRGRIPVLIACLVIFSIGSWLTAIAYDLPTMVLGRFWQGVGGGGLIPATLALVADLYPPERRGTPLGLVSAVQEIGSVLGPLLGAAILVYGSWRLIFVLNLLLGALLTGAITVLARRQRASSAPRQRYRFDWVGLTLALVAVVATTLTCLQPTRIKQDLAWGALFVPLAAEGRWLTPIGLIGLAAVLGFWLWCAFGKRPLVPLRSWWGSLRAADLRGAALLAVALSGIIVAFATADPKVQVFSPYGLWFLVLAAVAGLGFAWHTKRTPAGLLPHHALAKTPAWGALLVSFFVGAALIAALIDIPLFARTTVFAGSQFQAALVLVRFLVALPVGALVGGWLCRYLPPGWITALGMVCAALSFWAMSNWGIDTLNDLTLPSVVLALGGFGFGLALAPVNLAVLAYTDQAVHGLATALVVVARMVGMLVGISALTTLGLRRYYAEQSGLANVREVCAGASRCEAFNDLLRVAGIAQESVVFQGAAVSALIAGLAALWLFRQVPAQRRTQTS